MLPVIGTLLNNDHNYLFIQPQAHILHIYFKECVNTMICFAIQLCRNILLLYSSTEVSDPYFCRKYSFLKVITYVIMIEEAQ